MEKETGEWEKLSGEALANEALGRREESEKALTKLIATRQMECAYQIARGLWLSWRCRQCASLAGTRGSPP